jgi:membrane protein DedA with SNARE-associated domain
MKSLFVRLLPPLSIFVVSLFWHVLTALGRLPSLPELIVRLEGLLELWGLPFVLLISMVESTVFINTPSPGAVVILTSMARAAGDPWLGVQTFVAIHVGANFGYQVSYLIGRVFRPSLTPGQEKGLAVQAAVAYAHPNIGALSSMHMGQHRVPWLRFATISFSTSLFYNAIWGVLIYNLGNFITSGPVLWLMFYGYLTYWMTKEVLAWRAAERVS